MGFGTILLGYILTLFDSFGGGIVGCPLMAYGFYKVSRINGRFGICAVLSVISFYEPVLQVLAILKVADPNSAVFSTAHVISYAVKLAIIFTFYLSVIEIARVGKSPKLESGAMWRIYLNCASHIFMVISAFVSLAGMETLINIAYIATGLVNILFFWDCASKITTREQMRKDSLALKRLDDEEKKKAEKRRLKRESAKKED